MLAACAVFTVNYLLYAVFLTDFVEVLLALLGQPAESTAVARLAGTGTGTGLALLRAFSGRVRAARLAAAGRPARSH
jgi:hypothetical protein